MTTTVYTLAASQTVVNLNPGSLSLTVHISGPFVDDGQLINQSESSSNFDYSIAPDGLSITLQQTYTAGTRVIVESNGGDIVISTAGTAAPINDLIFYVPDPDKSRALGLGKVFIGEPDSDPQIAANQKQAYLIQENGSQIQIGQPITLNGSGVPVYNGSFARIAVSGNYSIKILNRSGVKAYYISNVLRTNEGIKKICYVLKAAPEAATLPAGSCFSVEELAGATFVVQPASYAFRDGDIVMGDGAVAELQDNDGYDVRWLGAKVDGVTDDSGAVQAAVDRKTSSKVRFPSSASACIIGTKIIARNKFIHIAGAGVGASQITYTGTDGLFDFTRTGAENALYEITNIKLVATEVKGGTCVKVEQDQASGVVGGIDMLHINNVVIESDGAGYWTIYIHQENAGGCVYSNLSMRNNGNATAQNDISTKGIYIDNSNSSIDVIRAMTIDNFYIQRCNRNIDLRATRSIESVYLDKGEMVGGDFGMHFNADVGAKIGAIGVGFVHMDHIFWNVFCTPDSTVNIMRLTGADLRINDNGASFASSGGNVRLENGERHIYTGCNFGVPSKAGAPLSTWIGVNFDGTSRNMIDGCAFRSHDNAIKVPVDTDSQIGVNTFSGVLSEYQDATDYTRHFAPSEILTTFKPDYDASIDDLADVTKGETFTSLGSSATGGPAAVSTSGAVVMTMVYDSNRAHQWFHGSTSSDLYYRVKTAGTFSAWVAK